MKGLPEAGVGMIYLPGLDNLLESHLPLLDVIEIEPQTLWYNRNVECDSFLFNVEQTKMLQAYPCHKLLHSVGFPVGGSLRPRDQDLALLAEQAAQLDPLWMSEHLSFNTIIEDGLPVNVNFLLPPLQTNEGIATAVDAIAHFRTKTGLPFAFETGTNYLQPGEHDISDGAFVTAIAEQADCHILLDLHNIMANQINGRQSVTDFINELPLERVCEIHLAGGFFHKGYYLDGHSGASSKELLDIAASLIRRLPNLKALIFEMLPEYVNDVSAHDMRVQFEAMRRLWDVRAHNYLHKKTTRIEVVAEPRYTVKEWEQTLGKLAIERPVACSPLSEQFAADKGINIINELIFHFRASMVVTTLKLTTRLLRMSVGREKFNEDLKHFFSITTPDAFAFAVAKKYADYVLEQNLDIPYLYKIMEYELACLSTLSDKEPRSVAFDFNPFPVLRSLTEGQLPGEQDTPMSFILDIQPDELTSSEALNFLGVYHN